jgi:hypothetical protein
VGGDCSLGELSAIEVIVSESCVSLATTVVSLMEIDVCSIETVACILFRASWNCSTACLERDNSSKAVFL